MSITWLIWLGIVSGSGAGLLAGLIGIGGGIVVVPVVYFGLLTSGIPQDEAVHVAVATSLAAILPAAIVSFLTHRRAGKYGLRLPEGLVSGYRGGRCHSAVRGSARAGQCNDCNLCRALSGFRGPVCFSQTLSPLSGPAAGWCVSSCSRCGDRALVRVRRDRQRHPHQYRDDAVWFADAQKHRSGSGRRCRGERASHNRSCTGIESKSRTRDW